MTCGLPECEDERHGDHDVQNRSQTLETDVYAFGCIYHSVRSNLPQLTRLILAQTFFDNVPFSGKNDFQVARLVMDGVRPGRLESPAMEDDTWNLIQSCWEPIPSKRPTIDQIVKALTPPG
jgi:hypothetical protein